MNAAFVRPLHLARTKGSDGGTALILPMSVAQPPREADCANVNEAIESALDEVMTKVPLEQATPACLAECILKAAAEGQTNYQSLVAAASDQIQTILSMLT
jgi:hypothetical protein